MPLYSYYIKTSACEVRGSILAATPAIADTAIRNEYTKIYKVTASNITPTVTTLTITAVT